MNILNEKINIVMTMSDEVFHCLPEVSLEDLQTKRERYRLLLGKWEIEEPSLYYSPVRIKEKGYRLISERLEFKDPKNLLISVEAVLEIPDPAYYVEKNGRISGINLLAIKKLISDLRNNHSGYSQLVLVGDIHTHPTLQNELDDHQRPWHPSSLDIKYLADTYKCGELDGSQPFIFGIAGAIGSGKTGYAFYRLIKANGDYLARAVNRK